MLTIVDLSHHEKACIPLLAKAKEQGLTAVITKCTEGRNFLDPSYVAMRDACKAAGILFGSYHFATNSDIDPASPDDDSLGIEQADWFLKNADPDSLFALDYEWSKHRNMTTRNAELFVDRVYVKTGRRPILYTSRSYINEVQRPAPDSSLAKCELWLCWYNDTHPEKHLPVSPWKQWSLWQYTNGVDGPSPDLVKYPRKTLGLGSVDRSMSFTDDEATFREWWNNVGRDAGPACRP